MTAAVRDAGEAGLDGAFPPEFAAFGRTLREPARDAVALPDLLRPGTLAGVVARWGAPFGAADMRAVLSFWSQYYLLALVPAATAAALAARRDLPLALDRMGAVLSPSGCPEALCLPHAGGSACAACPVTCLTPLLRRHLEPLAERLASAGLPPRVLWGNVGAVLAWSLDVVAAPADRVAAVRAALPCALWLDGGPNPLRGAYDWVVPGPGRTACGRRVCCLRYRLPNVALCPGCPRSASDKVQPTAPSPACGRGPG